jgi:hypothetical protein
MGMKEILGTISPAYGVMKGEGLFGELAPHLGVIPNMISKDREEKEEKAKEKKLAAATAAKPAGMKKGGMVKSSASKRADGCATKGKTRGKMV